MAPRRFRRRLLLLALAHRALCLGLLLLVSLSLVPFDTSSQIQRLSTPSTSLVSSLASALVRWDVVHFVGLASPHDVPIGTRVVDGGYRFEHSTAFQPGIVWLLRISGVALSPQWHLNTAVVVTSLLATLCGAASVVVLYEFLLRLTRSHRIASLAAHLSILSPSPATMVSPTPEPFYSLFAAVGLLLLAPPQRRGDPPPPLPPSRSGAASSPTRNDEVHVSTTPPRGQPPGGLVAELRALLASLAFMAATALRANGLLNVGFLWWYLVWMPPRRRGGSKHGEDRRSSGRLDVPRLAFRIGVVVPLCTSLVLLPFVLSQAWLWTRFCSLGNTAAAAATPASGMADEAVVAETSRRPWCGAAGAISPPPPSLRQLFAPYSFVQSQYWGVGAFRYWSVSQLPNFALALPVLVPLFVGVALRMYAVDVRSVARATLLPWAEQVGERDDYGATTTATKTAATTTTTTTKSASSKVLAVTTGEGGRDGHDDASDHKARTAAPEPIEQSDEVGAATAGSTGGIGDGTTRVDAPSSPRGLLLAVAHHSWLQATLLLVHAHVQIALRMCTPGGMPMYWLLLAQGLGRSSDPASASAAAAEDSRGSDVGGGARGGAAGRTVASMGLGQGQRRKLDAPATATARGAVALAEAVAEKVEAMTAPWTPWTLVWLVGWNATSLVLSAAFYPPA